VPQKPKNPKKPKKRTRRKKARKPARSRKRRAAAEPEQPVVYMVSLGCPKNQVDSERLAAALAGEGFLLTAHPGDADLALVNTCAFIEEARAETREVLAEMQLLKKKGKLRAVVAAGCYPQRNRQIPGADQVLPFRDYPHLAARCRKALGLGRRKRRAPPPGVLSCAPRLRFGLKSVAYLKISEGCDNSCAYCTIPKIRGRMRSRPMKEVLAEAEELISDGAREIILIAQDTAAYGMDLPGGKPLLAELIRKLLEMPTYHWLRLMYAHPAHLTDEVVELLGEGRFTQYLDMPIQHVDDDVLKAMGRGYDSERLRQLIIRIRTVSPRTALRTTCMVGFPGETPQAYSMLRTFLVEARFDHMGVFEYSPEPGTRAARRKGQVSDRTKHKRREELMGLQKLVASGRGMERIGDQMTVLIESAGGGPAIGRSQFQAPEVDGRMIITRPHAGLAALRPGEFHRVVVTGAYDYDMVARLI
jgi:ribosomal protein S12 methylthiotransferase